MSDFIDLSDGNGTDADADTAHASQTSPPGQLLAPLVPMTPTTAKHAFLQYPLIVDLDSSFDSNPFDQIQRIANTFDDPFESVHSKAMTSAPLIATSTTAAAQRSATTDTLIQLDEQMANSASMDAKMLTDLAALQAEAQPMRAGDDEDCVVFASPTNSSKAGQSANSTAVSAAAARRTQLLKFSIANAKAAHAAATQPLGAVDGSTGSQQSTPDPKGATRWPSLVTDGFDDLMATSPGCLVDSDEPDDGSDLEQLCIPFLKRQQSGGENALGQPHADVAAVVDEGAATAAAAADDVASSCRPRAQKCLLPSTGGGGHIQQHLLDRLERHKAAAAATAAAAHSATDASPPAAMPVLLEDSAGEQPVDAVAGERSAADRQHLTALLASVKQEIERFGDRTEARALLDGLQSALDRSSPVASSVSPSLQSSGASDAAASVVPEPMPTVIRQGTFTKVEAGVDKAAAEAAAVQEGIDDELDSGLQATGAADDSLSPNTSNLAHVMEQLGRMQLSRINHVLAVPGSDSVAAVPAAPTYIVLMNTPVAAKSAHHRPKVCSTPIVQIHAASPPDDGGGCGGGGDDSPSSYLRTRTNSTRRSLSLSVRQKPSAVATAIASRAELRSRANSMAPTTPLRSTTRRSTFSSHGHTAADQPPKAFASSAAVAAAAAAAASGKLQSARRSMYDASSGRGPAASVTADRRPSPNRLLAPSPAKPLAKSPAKQRRSISFAPATTRHSAAAAPPTLLKASVMPPISQLKLRTHAAAAATAASGPSGGLRAGTAHGPMRATQPMRAIVAPRARSTTSTATATTPRKVIAPPAATAASSSSALLALPGAAGQRRTSNIGHVASATPSSKRLSTVTAAVGTAATSHHRRSMSEGKSSLALTPRQSAAHSTHFGVGSRRLSTLSGAHVRHSKENQPPK